MQVIHRIVIHTTGVAMAVFGCGAVMAQSLPPNAPPAAGAERGSATPGAASPGSKAQRQVASDIAAISKEDTQHFISEAAYANDAEIADARYALAHSQSPEVKAFARKMIADHTKAGEQLTMLASSEGYIVPSGVTSTDRMAMQRLEKDQGVGFQRRLLQVAGP